MDARFITNFTRVRHEEFRVGIDDEKEPARG
jgi:hypothetical protein